MAEIAVLICDWCKARGRTTLAAEVVKIVRPAHPPMKLALCGDDIGELLTGAVKATKGGRRAPIASELKIAVR